MATVAMIILFWFLRIAVLVGALVAVMRMARQMPTKWAVGISIGIFLAAAYAVYRVELGLINWYCEGRIDSSDCRNISNSD